jgi:hypothetical protein
LWTSRTLWGILFSSGINLHKENSEVSTANCQRNYRTLLCDAWLKISKLNPGRKWQIFYLHFLWVPNVAAKGGSKAFCVLFELQLHLVHKPLCCISRCRLYNVWRGYSITDHSQSAQAILRFQISYLDNGE